MDDTRSFPTPDAGTSPLAPADERKRTEFPHAPAMPDGPDVRHGNSAPPEADTLAELENMLRDIRQELPDTPTLQTGPDTLAELASVLEDIRQEQPTGQSPPTSDAVPPPHEIPQSDGFSQDISSTLQELTSILTELTGKNPASVPPPAKPAAQAPLTPTAPPSPPLSGNPSPGSPLRATPDEAGPTGGTTAFPAAPDENAKPVEPVEPEVPPVRPWGNNRPHPPRHGLNTPLFTGRNPLGDEHLLLPPNVLDFIPEPDEPDATPEGDIPSVPVAMALPPEISWDSLWEDKPAESATSALPDGMPLRSFIPPEDLLETEDREYGLPVDMPPSQAMPVFPPAAKPASDAGARPAETAAAAVVPRTPAKTSAIPSTAARERAERREAREQARKERRQLQADTAVPRPVATPAPHPPAPKASRQPEDQAAMDTLSELRKLLSTIAVPSSGSAGGQGSSGKPGVKPPASPWRQPVRPPLPPLRRSRSSADLPEKRTPETLEANAELLASRSVWRTPREAATPAKPSDPTARAVFPNPADDALLLPPVDLDAPAQPAPSPLLDLTGIAQAMNLEFHAAQCSDPASGISSVLLPVPGAADRTAPPPASPDDDAPVEPTDAPSDNAEDASEMTTPDSAAASPSAAITETPPAEPEAEPVDAVIPPTPAAEQELPPGWLNRLGQRLRRVFRHSPPDGGPKTNHPLLRARTDDLTTTLPADTVPPPVEPSEAAPGGLMQRLREMEAEHRERLRALSERPRGPVYPSAEARSHLLRYSLTGEPASAQRRRLTDDNFPAVPGTGPIHVLRDKPTAWERFFRALRAKMRNESFRQGVSTAAFYTAALAALGGALYASSHPDQVEQAVQSLLRLLP